MTSIISFKTLKHALNAHWKGMWQLSFMEVTASFHIHITVYCRSLKVSCHIPFRRVSTTFPLLKCWQGSFSKLYFLKLQYCPTLQFDRNFSIFNAMKCIEFYLGLFLPGLPENAYIRRMLKRDVSTKLLQFKDVLLPEILQHKSNGDR